jgi:hypothetical protein
MGCSAIATASNFLRVVALITLLTAFGHAARGWIANSLEGRSRPDAHLSSGVLWIAL